LFTIVIVAVVVVAVVVVVVGVAVVEIGSRAATTAMNLAKYTECFRELGNRSSRSTRN